MDAMGKIMHELYMIAASLPKKPIIVEKFIDCDVDVSIPYRFKAFFINAEIAFISMEPYTMDCSIRVVENDNPNPEDPSKPYGGIPEGPFIPIEDETIPWFAQDYNYEVEYEDQMLIREEWFSFGEEDSN